MDIFKKITEFKAENERLAWTGTFREYYAKVRENPNLAMTAHARVYNMISSYGTEEVNGTN